MWNWIALGLIAFFGIGSTWLAWEKQAAKHKSMKEQRRKECMKNVQKRPYSILAQTLEEMAILNDITGYFMSLRTFNSRYYGEFWWYPHLLGNFTSNRTIIWIQDDDLESEESFQLWLDGIVEHFINFTSQVDQALKAG